MRANRLVTVLVVVGILHAYSPPAHAGDGDAILVVGYAIAGVVVSPFVNLVAVVDNERPNVGWIIGGMAAGTILLAIGALLLADTSETDDLGVGLGLLGWGGFCLSMAIGASVQPDAPQGTSPLALSWR